MTMNDDQIEALAALATLYPSVISAQDALYIDRSAITMLIDQARNEVGVPDPDTNKLAVIASGIAVGVQTVGSLGIPWLSVKAALAKMGVSTL